VDQQREHAGKLTTTLGDSSIGGDGEKGQDSDEFELYDGREDFYQDKSVGRGGTRPKEDS